VDEAARDRVRNILEPWRREARVLIEVAPRHLPQKGYFVGPTIFADVRPDSPLAQQPIFGPVLLVTAAPDFDTALQLASSGDGLTAGVYSRSPAHIDLARRELRAGSVFINRKITGSRVELQPLGPDRDGVGGPDFLFRFLRPRSVTENTLRHGLAAVDDVQMTTHAD
jgi:RHH-type proline utilization regulon transcriptional repressor/proline dehydrogenase/delta 1-pyrroline-5-carboxylate dehydrogenase